MATDVLKDNKTYLKPYLTGTAFVVGWACGMSGGLATNQIMIPMGFLLGSLYCHLGYFNTQLFHLFAISLISLLLVTMGISKNTIVFITGGGYKLVIFGISNTK